MTRLDTRIVTALLARDSKDATYKFALLRAIVQCVSEQRAHKRIDENPFARGTGAGSGQGAPSTRKDPSGRKLMLPDDGSTRNPKAPVAEASRKRIHPDDGFTQKPILPNAPYVISYPLGLLVYFWMFYYYPIFAHRVFIPQKNGETPCGSGSCGGCMRGVTGISFTGSCLRGWRQGGAVAQEVAGEEVVGRGDAERRDEFDPAIGSLKQISAYLIDKRGVNSGFPGLICKL